jgi:hypothetical protein
MTAVTQGGGVPDGRVRASGILCPLVSAVQFELDAGYGDVVSGIG